MSNNPFRSKPLHKVDQKTEDWGKVKFKPNKFGGGGAGKSHFNKRQDGKGNFGKFNNRKGNFNKNKDSFKFNQVARDAKPENATPWNKFKDDIVFKQREDEQAALQANMDSEEAKLALKQREMSYRKLLIEQNKQQPTQWENFSDEDDKDSAKKNKKKYKSNQETNDAVNKGQFQSKKNKKKLSKNINELNPKSKSDFKKNISNAQLKGEVKELISQELLNNFDSKKLNFKQNDQMRKIITKVTTMTHGTSLEMAIKDMKRKKTKKEKQNKNFS
ncbi:hypothetical protein DOY81_005084 [Sarcophaga bullata]|nr:hypothetical protein DOY81_005084 [Sarcophaga bullata]